MKTKNKTTLKKRWVWLTGLMLSLIAVTVAGVKIPVPSNRAQTPVGASVRDKVFGVWINYMEFARCINGQTETAYQATVQTMLDNIESLGLNTVFLQVRSHSDSFYPSKIFPWSSRINGGEGVEYDPLAIFIHAAHTKGIQVHGWVNPYRVSAGTLDELPAGHPARSMEEGAVVQTETGVYYNPASAAVRSLVLSGIRELLDGYDLDGIQYDDYFYPTTQESFDETLYAQYCNMAASPLPLGDWRRSQVNTLMAGTYQVVRQYQDVVFGVSPAASIENNYRTLYADVSAWVAGGYVDYLCPQLYFGFHYPDTAFSFDALAKQWTAAAEGVPLYLGLASYKVGKEDNTSTEWVTNTDLLSRQTEYARQLEGVSGVCLYHYGSLFQTDAQATAQRQNLKRALEEFS